MAITEEVGVEDGARTGQAFCLVLAAAGATALGSCAVFYPSLAQYATGRVLSASLGFATGVMLYVSLVDIYSKSIVGFQDFGYTSDQSFIYTTMSFFAGIFIMKLIDMLIHHCTSDGEFQVELGMEEMVARNEMLRNRNSSWSSSNIDDKGAEALVMNDPISKKQSQEVENDETAEMSNQRRQEQHHLPQRMPSSSQQQQENPDYSRISTLQDESYNSRYNDSVGSATSGSRLPPPVRDLLEFVENGGFSATNTTRTEQMSSSCVTSRDGGDRYRKSMNNGDDDDDEIVEDPDQQKQLFSMGAVTAAAIALHNFPEGLVTFVAYIEDPAVGVALAIGIAIHNIPEGLCVSMPIYYATSSRWTAFWWGSFSGMSEPLGALTGWLILQSSFSGQAYGILFGCVAGMMVYICLDELLPMAFKFDPQGSIVTWTCISGMFLVALSLVLFSLS